MMERRALLLAIAALAAIPALAAACATGETQCFCEKAGGTWRSELGKGDMPVACTFYLKHQGRDRSYNVYLPQNYDGKRRQPVWMHLHGVYTSEWGGDLKAQYPGEAVLCRDACPLWDGLAGAKTREGLSPGRADGAIVVYPETLIGDPYKRSFWSVPWWRCSMGDCVPSDADDVGFLERAAQDVQRRFSGAGRLFASGNSSGGMMLYRLLCESEWFARHLAAASVFSGGMGRDYRCADGSGSGFSAQVPLLITHGAQDEVIGYQFASVVDGSPFMAVVDTARALVDARACAAEGKSPAPPAFGAAQGLECRDYCEAGGAAAASGSGLRLQAPVEQQQKQRQQQKLQGRSRRSLLSSGRAGEVAAPAAANATAAAAAESGRRGVSVSPAPTSQQQQQRPARAFGDVNAAGARTSRGEVPDSGERDGTGPPAPVRFCSLPAGKHNLNEVARAFPIDASAAWFAKHGGSAWTSSKA